RQNVRRGEPPDLVLNRHPLPPEHRYADHVRVKTEAERTGDGGSENHNNDVIRPAVRSGLRCSTDIAAALGGNTSIDTPSQERPEQQDGTEVAIRTQMTSRPGTHRGQQ